MPIRKKILGDSLADTTVNANKPNKHARLSKVLVVILVLVLIALFASIYSQRKTTKKIARLSTVSGQKEVAKKEIDSLVAKVNKLIILPKNETPTVATVANVNELAKTQAFYSDASNGDKVLIYFKAEKAYIYNPNKNILVNVGPVYIDKTKTQTTTTKKKIEDYLNIEIRNGSEVTGKATLLSEKIKKNKLFKVTTIGNAVTNTYKQTILVKLSSKKDKMVSALESNLNLLATTTLPTGEISSSADVLIIVGEK